VAVLPECENCGFHVRSFCWSRLPSITGACIADLIKRFAPTRPLRHSTHQTTAIFDTSHIRQATDHVAAGPEISSSEIFEGCGRIHTEVLPHFFKAVSSAEDWLGQRKKIVSARGRNDNHS
jgi:hypothetical protein